MYSFPDLEPVYCSISSTNCCFLSYIQISLEAGQMVWYSHLLKNFLHFLVIHRVKWFSTVNKTEVDAFLELTCFFYDPEDVDNLISGSSAFSKSSLNIWSSWFMYSWSQAWKILSITLLACEMSTKKPLDESESAEQKCWLKAQHSENKDHGILSHHFMGNRCGNSVRLYFFGLHMVTAAMKLKYAYSLKGKLWPT